MMYFSKAEYVLLVVTIVNKKMKLLVFKIQGFVAQRCMAVCYSQLYKYIKLDVNLEFQVVIATII